MENVLGRMLVKSSVLAILTHVLILRHSKNVTTLAALLAWSRGAPVGGQFC